MMFLVLEKSAGASLRPFWATLILVASAGVWFSCGGTGTTEREDAGDVASVQDLGSGSDVADIVDLASDLGTPDLVPLADAFDSLDADSGTADVVDDTSVAVGDKVQDLAGKCVKVAIDGQWLSLKTEFRYTFVPNEATASSFYLQPSDLGTYLFYDTQKGYLTSDDGELGRKLVLDSDVTLVKEYHTSEAEWVILDAPETLDGVVVRHLKTEKYLGLDGLGPRPAVVSLSSSQGCAVFPEMSLDATGSVAKTAFEDGALFGIADIHEHQMSNISFGGGIYHGAAFHRLGVQHALPDCSMVHGEAGRSDFFGYVYDHGGNDSSSIMAMVDALFGGQLPEDNHVTAGWPEFTEWPNARTRSTHQTMYYKWLERAWMAGLRLMVQHATNDYIICSLMVGEGIQHGKHDCEDMTSVDKIIDETWALQRYVDAQWGGDGKGWYRVVRTPAEAREVISQGKLAVIIGIETSNLFRCHLTPRPNGPVCDEEWVDAQLDLYYEKGVRAVFPVHKYDNRFTPGDGNRDFIELGNFFNSGHWSNFTLDCPPGDLPHGFDNGRLSFGGLLQPRDDYLSQAPNDVSGFSADPIGVGVKFIDLIAQPSLDGDWCQNGTITPIGEVLLNGLMDRGMIIEIDHFPQWSYQRAFEILDQAEYPAVGSHGRHWNGRIFEKGGMASFGLNRCQDPDNPGASVQSITDRASLIESKGQYPGVPLGFDLNGFAGAPGPRFAPGACWKEQPNPITYPFSSYAGDASFSAPSVGNRLIDFNMEGFVHIGMLPELIQDARADAGDDKLIEPLFRSAEAYVRMWELAELRSKQRDGE